MRKYLLKKSFLLGLLICAAVAAPAPAEARRPKNFRKAWKKAVVVEEWVEPSTAAARGPQRVMPGRWTPAARAAIDKFLLERGSDSKGYDAAKPPVAVLPWSDALVAGDPAELVFLRLTTRVDFRFEDS